MISDLDLARACQATYHEAPTLPVPSSGAYVRITPGADGKTKIVAIRGSVTGEDWARDVLFEPIEDREHPQLGFCHAGFLDGAESIVDAIGKAVSDDPYVLTGHSLGGAVALGVGAILVLRGKSPQAIVTFGAPRFGMDKFVAVLLPVSVRQYHRGNCPIVGLPPSVPPLLRFLDARLPLIQIGQPQRIAIKSHSIDGYVDDVAAFLTEAAHG